MALKPVLDPIKIINGLSMGASITSAAVEIKYFDDIGVQLVWTGSPVGTFQVQASADHRQDAEGNITTPGSWTNIALNPSPDTTGGSPIYIDMATLSAPYIRVVYTRTSGTGTLTAHVVGKLI